jgi:hypothetical protein
MRRHELAGWIALGTIGLGAPPTAAHAQSEGGEPASAAALFSEAKQMMDKGNFADACPKLARSEALDPQVGTMLNLALCYESVGKIASACSSWREAADAAARKLQSDRVEFARERADGLCAHVPRVTVDVAPQRWRDRVEVTLNDTRVPSDRWGVPAAMDPGEYELRATGEGLQPWSSKLLVDETHAPSVVVPVLAPAALEQTAGASRPSSTGRPSALVMAGWIVGATGLVSMGIGAAFSSAAIVSNDASNANRNCVSDNCNAAGSRDRIRAVDDARVADATLAAGGGAVAAGIVLWVLGTRAPKASGVRVQPAVGIAGCSILVSGAW